MIALQGYYNDGRLELDEEAPSRTASVLGIFPEEYPARQALKDDWAAGVPNRETAEAIHEGRTGVGLRCFADAQSMFAALDSEPDDVWNVTLCRIAC